MSERILYVDLSTMTADTAVYSYAENRTFGRDLVHSIFREHVGSGTDRYSPDNIIVLAPGLFTGTYAPSACRMLVATIEGKDRGISLCNTTGNMPQKLGSLGIAAVVIRGKAAEKGTVVHIDSDGVTFEVRADLNGKRTGEIVRAIKDRYQDDSAIIGCSIAGDMMMSLSTFFCTYPDGIPEYHCPRQGFGDVWGSKNLRAVVVDGKDYFARECADPDRFRALGRELTQKIINDEICGGALPAYGSITLMKILAGKTSQKELAPPAGGITADTEEKAPADGRRRNRTCAPMCVIGCLNRHASKDGRQYASPAQAETQGAITRCFDTDDYDLAQQVQQRASEIGIVATEFVTACKVYAEAENIEHGEDHLLEWLDEIKRGTLIGRVIASRTYGIADLYRDADLKKWVDRKAVQDESLFDVQMKTAYPGLPELNALELLYAQEFVLENLGFCIFTSFALLDKAETFEILAKMFEAMTGSSITGEELIRHAHTCMLQERDYQEQRWKDAQSYSIPSFTKVLYRYFDKKRNR